MHEQFHTDEYVRTTCRKTMRSKGRAAQPGADNKKIECAHDAKLGPHSLTEQKHHTLTCSVPND